MSYKIIHHILAGIVMAAFARVVFAEGGGRPVDQGRESPSARCLYFGVIPAAGRLTVTGSRTGVNSEGLEQVAVALRDDEQTLRTVNLVVGPVSGALIPAVEARNDEGVWLFGTARGLLSARSAMKGVRKVRRDLPDLPMGIMALTEENIVDLDGVDGIALFERNDRTLFILFDTTGLIGIRFAVNDAVFNARDYVRTARSLLRKSGVSQIIPDQGEGLGGVAGTCCINCGGQGTCCCSSTPCSCGDRSCACLTETCSCAGSGCSCNAGVEY